MASLDAIPRTRLERDNTPKDQPSYQKASAIKQEYEFFVSTSTPHQLEGTKRALIRRLVMRNFFETKGAGRKITASESHSASTVMAKTRLKNRFRLSEPRRDQEEYSKEESNKVKRKRAKIQGTSCVATCARNQAENTTKTSKKILKVENRQDRTANEGPKHASMSLTPNPNTHRFDPFDVLPVPGTPSLDRLFKLYKSGSRKNSIAINAKHTWWSFISTDAGLLHATLATWALYGMLVKGPSDLHVQQLRHKNEAIKEINMKLARPESEITDELIGTVVTMASFENLTGSYPTALLHLSALQRMIASRGGISAFSHNDGLVRAATWTDFHLCTVYRRIPSFPYVQFSSEAATLPNELLEEAAYTSPTSLLQLDVGALECFNIFYRLHRVSLAMCEKWVGRVSRGVMSDMLYEIEYAILSVPDYSSSFDHGTGTLNGSRYARADAGSVVEAILAAAQIFIYAVLRDIPTNTRIFTILLQRLRSALDLGSNTSLLSVWRLCQNLNILLWVLVVATSVQSPGRTRAWWVAILVHVCGELEIESLEGLRVALMHVAWLDTWFDACLDGIWEEVINYSQQLLSKRG